MRNRSFFLLTVLLAHAALAGSREEDVMRFSFEPVIKKRDARGEWREVEHDRLLAKPLDPELRVFARSSSDDKGPIMMLLTV